MRNLNLKLFKIRCKMVKEQEHKRVYSTEILFLRVYSTAIFMT